jgi:hypothetical protein
MGRPGSFHVRSGPDQVTRGTDPEPVRPKASSLSLRRSRSLITLPQQFEEREPMDDDQLAEAIEAYRLADVRAPPVDKILVHNRVAHGPRTEQGINGFRAWWATPGEEYASCDCGWRPDLGPHYRVGAH